MSFLRKCSGMLLLALPLAAVAVPVTVTTHSTGIHQVNDASIGATYSLLNVLGLEPPTSAARLPYALTLESTFDTDIMARPGSFQGQAYDDVVIDFRIGTQAYHYAGPAYSMAHLGFQSANVEELGHTIFIDTPNYRYGFVHELLGAPGSLREYDPQAPFDIDESRLTHFSAHLFFNLFAEPISFSVDPVSATMSVHMTPVPEPASFALLAAGLATLTWLHAKRRGRSRASRRCQRPASGHLPRRRPLH